MLWDKTQRFSFQPLSWVTLGSLLYSCLDPVGLSLLQNLLDFQYIEPNGKDQGINVRKKAQSLVALINDKGKIREVRHKAAANRDK